jgi:transcriptional regulator with XRE-family HTH domain
VREDLNQGLNDLGDFIRDQRLRAEMSLRRLSELSGISNPYLSQIERGLRKPSADILQQLAKALEVSAETLYVQAGMLDADPGLPSVTEAISRDPRLSREQKQSLLTVYRSFVDAADTEPIDVDTP